METDTFKAMNTTIALQGLPERWRTLARSWFAFAEAQLSRFLPDSELSRLNRAEGRPFAATPLLYQLLAEADRYCRETNGLFSPYLGRVMERLGYDDSFERLDAGGTDKGLGSAESRGSDQMPDSDESRVLNETLGSDACYRSGWHEREAKATGKPEADNGTASAGDIDGLRVPDVRPAELDPRSRIIRLRPELAADLGGIAKGWTARHLAKLAKQDGVRAGAIGAGGDLILWGSPPDGWRIGIADPWQLQADKFELTLRKGAGIATSSAIRRRWKSKDGALRHHIVDPRTGDPAQTDLAQATVIAPDAVMAEVYVKCVLLLGADAGKAWLERHNPGCAMVGILKNGEMRFGGDLEPFAMKEAGGYERIS